MVDVGLVGLVKGILLSPSILPNNVANCNKMCWEVSEQNHEP